MNRAAPDNPVSQNGSHPEAARKWNWCVDRIEGKAKVDPEKDRDAMKWLMEQVRDLALLSEFRKAESESRQRQLELAASFANSAADRGEEVDTLPVAEAVQELAEHVAERATRNGKDAR